MEIDEGLNVYCDLAALVTVSFTDSPKCYEDDLHCTLEINCGESNSESSTMLIKDLSIVAMDDLIMDLMRVFPTLHSKLRSRHGKALTRIRDKEAAAIEEET